MSAAIKVYRNIVANFIGKGTGALASFLFIPSYIKLLGIEAYALIGFFIILTNLFVPFDAALGSSLNREMSRLSAQNAKPEEMRNLLRTLEWIYWPVACFLGLAILIGSKFIVSYWITPNALSVQNVQQSIFLMGLALIFQWPISLYNSGLAGLQKQVTLNSIQTVFVFLRYGGAFLILTFLSPTVQAFFLWQLIISAIHSVFMAIYLWCLLPKSAVSASFGLGYLKQCRNFVAGMGILSILTIILMNCDKLILSKILPLEQFGYYSLAATAANGLYLFITPVFSAFFPRFSELVALGEKEKLKQVYYNGSKLLATIVFPLAFTIAFFSQEMLLIWTKNAALSEVSYPILGLLILGTACNGLMNLPFALQLSYGWTKLAVIQNIVSVILLCPAFYYLAERFGAIGAASMWLIHNLGCIVFILPIIHRKLLNGGLVKWYSQAVLPPLIIAFLVTYAAKMVFTFPVVPFEQFFVIIGVFIFGILATTFFMYQAQPWLKSKLLS